MRTRFRDDNEQMLSGFGTVFATFFSGVALATCLGSYLGLGKATAAEKALQNSQKVRYAQIDFRGKMTAPGMSPYDREYIGHVHYTLSTRLPSCQAEFDSTAAGLVTLVFPASCPEKVPLEGLVSTHQEKCGPVLYTRTPRQGYFNENKPLMVKTSTSRDAPPVTTAIIGCR